MAYGLGGQVMVGAHVSVGVIGMDAGGLLICRVDGDVVSSRETLESFGFENLSGPEKVRLNIHDTVVRQIYGVARSEVFSVIRQGECAWLSMFPEAHMGYSRQHNDAGAAERYLLGMIEKCGGVCVRRPKQSELPARKFSLQKAL